MTMEDTMSDPTDTVRENLDVQVERVADAGRRVLRMATWRCNDGHEHPRPETFTHRRLAHEINQRNPGNTWTGATISLGVYRLVDRGELARDDHWVLRRTA
jgi:hypothetical protein